MRMADRTKCTFIAIGLLATFLSAAKAQDAGQILDASGVQGGLVLVIGYSACFATVAPPGLRGDGYEYLYMMEALNG